MKSVATDHVVQLGPGGGCYLASQPHLIQYHTSSLFQYMRTKYTLYIYIFHFILFCLIYLFFCFYLIIFDLF